MPFPRPRANESRADFIARCSSAEADAIPDNEQRAAACHRAWRERNAGARILAGALDEEGYASVHRAADPRVPACRKAFEKDVREVAAAVEVTKLERALADRDTEKAVALVLPGPHFLDDLAATLEETFFAAARAAERDLNRALRSASLRAADVGGPEGELTLSFDETNPRAVQRARERAGELVREVSGSMREAVRAQVVAGLEGGIGARELARRIVDEGLGLTEAQVDQVAKFRATLEEKGVEAERVEARTRKYHDAVLRRRAENVARTETMASANAGAQETFLQSRDAGLIDADAKREFIATMDDRVDPVCEEMDGQTVGLDEPFVTPDGDQITEPPVHPSCRCTFSLSL